MTTRLLSPSCIKFHQNPRINPITGSTMEPNSFSYKQLVKECGSPPGTIIPTVVRSPLLTLTSIKPIGTAFPTGGKAQVIIPTPIITRPTVIQPTLPTIIRPAFPQVMQPRIPSPTIVPQPTVFEQRPLDNDYYPQDEPNPDQFKFTATEENSAFIQATIESARNMFPSLELFIQGAESVLRDKVDIDPELMQRNRYPSFMRDATPYEIYKIYRGPEADLAQILL